MKRLIIDSYTGQRRIALTEDKDILEYRVESSEKLYGNIYKGKVINMVSGLEAAFVDIGYKRNAYLPLKKGMMNNIVPGNFIIAQVTKESIGNKGPKLTRDITLPGKYLVLTPFSDNIGISHRIDSESEKKRLKEEVKQIKPEDMGIIVRTDAVNAEYSELNMDLEKLLKKWDRILNLYKTFMVPVPIYRGISSLENSLLDMVTDDVAEIVVNSGDDYEYLYGYLQYDMPAYLHKLKMKPDPDIFKSYGIEESVDNIFKRKINLKSGDLLL